MNHANSWGEYINQLHQYIRQQDQKIKELEQRISQMENNKSKGNHTTIEKLEYHFDQLKIERLDGTLHIGLTPEELSKADDVSVNQQPNSMQQQVVGQLDSYINEQGPSILNELANEYGYPTNRSNQEMLLNDVRKQLKDRVVHYEQYAKNNNLVNNNQELSHYIFEQVQKEINHSLRQFFAKKEKD